LARAESRGLLTFVGLLSPDGLLIEVNASALEAAGLRTDDVLNRPLWETYWWSADAGGRERLQEAIAGAARGIAVRFNTRLRLSLADVRSVDMQMVPLRDTTGKVTRIVPTAIDVASDDLFDHLIAHAPVGFCQLDPALRFVRINDALAATNGLPVEEHIGRTPMQLLPGLPPEGYLAHLQAALAGEVREFELEGKGTTGLPRLWLERAYPLRGPDGGICGVGVFVFDITARKLIEIDRQRAMAALQQSLLPGDMTRIPAMDTAARYAAGEAATEVGGDFYDVLTGDGFGAAAFVGDVCGRGVEAAALASLARYTLVPLIEHNPDSPAAALVELNRILLEHHPKSFPDFLTVALVLLRRDGGAFEARLALGGHPPAALVRASGQVHLFGHPGSLLGVKRNVRIRDACARLEPGDALVLYTDGYTEARGPAGELFGEERICACLAAVADASADQIADTLGAAVDAFTTDAGPTSDDRALLVLKPRSSHDQHPGVAGSMPAGLTSR
jgi:PAS domain S-box-containing protein